MTIKVNTENCDFEQAALWPEALDSKVILRIEFPGHIPTIQSKNAVRQALLQTIQGEIEKFTWICFGPIWIELRWYIDAADRQETDAIGDLDNITKPILDSLTGLNGLFVDDSQIKTICTAWLAKNAATPENILEVSIAFLNDEVVEKNKLYFVQYHGPMCFAIDLNPAIEEELKAIRMFSDAKLLQRAFTAQVLEEHGIDLRFHFVASQKDFHRTRLSKIPPFRVYRLDKEKAVGTDG